MHVMHRFDTGGLENGVVNLINHMAPDAYRHMVVALTEVTGFRRRIRRDGVECIGLNKPPGHGAMVYPAFWRLVRRYRPAIVHTRNLSALEMQAAAWAMRVPARIHGEHGRDVDDVDGTSLRHQRIRRVYSPFVQRWVALSHDLQQYLQGPVRIPSQRIDHICNGVDSDRFVPPATPGVTTITGAPFGREGQWWIGAVGRMQPVKNQVLLSRAFVRARALDDGFRLSARLVMIGEGPLREAARAVLSDSAAEAAAWLPGERADVPDVMRSLDCFVLPSLGEGISNTILEAMATGLPVVATAVGGNAELVEPQRTGLLVASDDVDALASALLRLWRDQPLARRMGTAARDAVESRFSLRSMVAAYQTLYDRQLARRVA